MLNDYKSALSLTWMMQAACLMLTKCFLSRTALKRRCSVTILRRTSL